MSRELPEKFLERLQDIVGVSLCAQITQTFVERPTTFRVNTLKTQKHENTKTLLERQGFKIRQISWYKDAFVLLNRSKRDLTGLDIYREGKIYVQSLASMVPPLVLDPQPGEKVLDLTAAPGSKTSQIAALMNCQGELVANDNNKIRFFKLKHNMEVLGVTTEGCHPERSPEGTKSKDPLVCGVRDSSTALRSARNDNSVWNFTLRMEHGSALCREYPEYFDKILLDAPCSAEARFVVAKPETYGYWKESKIKEMAYKQAGLLKSAWSALKPNGILVYSTCTFAPEENELQISRFMERNSDCEILDIEILDINKLPIVKEYKRREINKEVIKKALRLMPSKEIEGFFVVKMRKCG